MTSVAHHDADPHKLVLVTGPSGRAVDGDQCI